MADENKSSRGRFLYLFEWNAKSRKKVFSNQPAFLDGLNQAKEFASNVGISQSFSREVFADRDGSVARGTCSSASSACDDDGNRSSRAPGVVAKLMGLESLPVPHLYEPDPLSFDESRVPGDSGYPRSDSGFRLRRHNVEYNGVDRFLWNNSNSMDSRGNKAHGRPIERFQAELLPSRPRTAKPISITQHKVLSAIKSPRLVPTNDAAYIVEAAAARFLYSTFQPPSVTKKSLFSSSSQPTSIRDPKEGADKRKYGLSKEPQHCASNKKIRKRNMQAVSKRTAMSKPPAGLEVCTASNSMNKGKGFSVGVLDTSSLQNLQRKQGSASCSNMGSVQKELEQVKPKLNNGEQSSQRNGHVKSYRNRSYSVLMLKGMDDRDKSTSKASIPGLCSRKASVNSSAGPSKVTSKVIVNTENGPRKRVPALARMENVCTNKEFVSKDSSSAENLFASDSLHTDVVSFTFTSPIKGSGSAPLENGGDIGISSVSSAHLRLNSVTGDSSLSLLLEQKVENLTDKVDSMQSDPIYEVTVVDTLPRLQVEKNGRPLKAVLQCLRSDTEERSCRSSSSGKVEGREEFNDAYLKASFSDCSNSHGSWMSSNSTAGGLSYPSSSCWELGYVKQMVCCAGIDQEFLLDENTEMMVTMSLFDGLEHSVSPTRRNVDGNSRADRRLLFDCVKEGLRLRVLGGGMHFCSFKAWARCENLMQDRDVLAAVLCKDVSRLREMGSLVLDELMEKDMSTGDGRWIEFETETFEEGMEMEDEIVACLIEELVVDIRCPWS